MTVRMHSRNVPSNLGSARINFKYSPSYLTILCLNLRRLCPVCHLRAQIVNVVVEPEPLQILFIHILSPFNHFAALAFARATPTLELAIHKPLRARIKEREHVTFLERAISADSHFPRRCVTLQAWRTRMIAEVEIGVSDKVHIGSTLRGGIVLLRRGCDPSYAGEDGSSG